jgi:hypothetical protein
MAYDILPFIFFMILGFVYGAYFGTYNIAHKKMQRWFIAAEKRQVSVMNRQEMEDMFIEKFKDEK